MRIIIELDNGAPVTLKVTPSDEEQNPTAPLGAAVGEAIDAGAAPTNDSSQSSTGGGEDFSDSPATETSAGPAPAF